MSHPRYQIFVSSTFNDLKDERDAVLKAILKLNQFPAGMEIFPAANDAAWDLIQKVIAESDYYVLIIGGKYGSMDEEGISYTEKEYNFAVEQGIPVLAFIHGNPNEISFGKSESDIILRGKLESFKDKVKSHHCNFWNTIDELKENVLASLNQAIVMNPQTGWIRAGRIQRIELLEQLAELQADLEKQKKENNRLKAIGGGLGSGSEKLSKGNDRLEFEIFWDHESLYQEISWNELFLCVGEILMHNYKVPEYHFKQAINRVIVSKLSKKEGFEDLNTNSHKWSGIRDPEVSQGR
jgi:hypothetical protein